MKYRVDIQVMRGIAVLVVVLFHLNFSFLKNGFLGVDIFFVLSGFLMAVLYKKGQVTSFYKRRAARLLPAYFATIVLTIIASTFITLSADNIQVVKQGLWGSFFSSNIGFWNQDSYFSTKFFNPLLHLWSLGVEIQFYVIVPLLFWLYTKYKWSIPIIFIISLFSAVLISFINLKTPFFLTPFRVWQFLVGAFVAAVLTDKGMVIHKRPSIGLFSVIILIVIILLYPVDSMKYKFLTGHIGLVTLLTTTATALILTFGMPDFILKSLFGKVLSKIGDWSYSIYLAHFPVIVLFLYTPLSGTSLKPESIGQTLVLLTLVSFFSAFLYLFFDKRRWNINFKNSAITIAFIWVLGFISIPISQSKESEIEKNIMASYNDSSDFRCGRLARVLDEVNISKFFACEITDGLDNSERKVLLIGDSTADAIKDSLAEEAARHNIKLYITSSNRFNTKYLTIERVIEEAHNLGVEDIIIHRYSPYVKRDIDNNTNEKLMKAGFNIVWILPVPEFKDSVPKLTYQIKNSLNFNYEPDNRSDVLQIKKSLSSSGVKIFDPWPYICSQDLCEISNKEGNAYYHDSLHMSLTGSKKLQPLYNELFNYIEVGSLTDSNQKK